MIEPADASDGSARSLSTERWALVRSLVEEALALPAEARPAFLDVACRGDDALRDRVGRLVAACGRAEDESWGFLARPAGELVAPLLAGDGDVLTDPALDDGAPAAFFEALSDRYAVGAEIGRGGMATVYVAEDVRHQRRVALKVLDPALGAMLGAERFLSEIRITAGLQQPNLVPLFDSGEAGGMLYYVMPLIDGATLRARLQRERQLPVDEAVGIVRTIAGALDYAHRHGVVHRDLKPENILLQDGQPLVADFGISLAVTNAADQRLTAVLKSFGTPQYMSPEQTSAESIVDGRSDIYSLACMLYELLVGDPPFTGGSAPDVIARVLSERPARVRTLRPTVPEHVDAAIARALSKLPDERHATAREFADAIALAPPLGVPGGRTAWWRDPARLMVGAGSTVVFVSAVWMVSRDPAALMTEAVLGNLIDQTRSSAVTITPDGRALVYTGSAEDGRLLMLRPLDGGPVQALAGTEGAIDPGVAPGGRRLAFRSRDAKVEAMTIDGAVTTGVTAAWRYGNGSWMGDSVVVTGGGGGLLKHEPGRITRTVLTRPDSAQGEAVHRAPLLLPGNRAVVFTVSSRGGLGVLTGQLAIASLDPGNELPSAHVLLDVTARRAIAFVQGWLLFIKADGTAIQAVRLDEENRRVSGTPITVLEDPAGNLETGALADNGTLLRVRRPRVNSVMFVDSVGAVRPLLAGTTGSSFMHPRMSPDGKRLAVQVTSGSDVDVWVYDMASRTPTRLTTTGRAYHPTWTPDGRRIVFFAAGRRELFVQPVDSDAATTLAQTEGAFAPTVTPDGRSVVFQRARSTSGPWSIWSASLIGAGPPRKVVDDPVSLYMPALSPDGRWLAYVSRATRGDEVYARPFDGPGQAVLISDSGGTAPAWSSDGHRIYYRSRDAFVEVAVTKPALAITSRRRIFNDPFDHAMPHRNYDVAPGNTGFLMIRQENPEAVITLNWETQLRSQLKRAR